MLLALIRAGPMTAFLRLISTLTFYKLINQEVRFARCFYVLTRQGTARKCELSEVLSTAASNI